ncbi:MAG TPA: lipoprotein [Fibrobacteraceae bacterium]|nr:lipoprotein [Fibrobacteraceae bacterium]
MKKIFVLLVAALLLAGCGGTMPVQAGGVIAKNSGTKVTSAVTSMNILGFTPMKLETAEQAISDLQKKCDGGNVTGVTAMVRQTYLFVLVKERLEVSGYCAD